MNEFAARTGAIVTFGPFTLGENERLLTRDGAPVELGGRAMDVLIVLVARANEVVSKHELMRLAWPGVVVSDGGLRFQITMLRQALGDGKDGARYIVGIVGRGYCFVAAISRQGGVDTPNPVEPVLPGQPPQLVGREKDLSEIGPSSPPAGSSPSSARAASARQPLPFERATTCLRCLATPSTSSTSRR